MEETWQCKEHAQAAEPRIAALLIAILDKAGITRSACFWLGKTFFSCEFFSCGVIHLSLRCYCSSLQLQHRDACSAWHSSRMTFPAYDATRSDNCTSVMKADDPAKHWNIRFHPDRNLDVIGGKMQQIKHIYVVGMDDFNLKELEGMKTHSDYENCSFHTLLSYDELRQASEVSFNELLDKARQSLDKADTAVDAIMTFWDFPAQTLVPLLCEERGLPSCGVNAVEKCEHKYWARKLQHQYVPEATPRFDAIFPFADDLTLPELTKPFWLKPVKSFSSYLAFKIDSEDDYQKALEKIRASIDTVAVPYNELLEHLDLADELKHVNGRWCIAEELIVGEQSTLEGYCFDGKVYCHGIIDSVCEENSSSFARYQYPSHLPAEVKQRMLRITEKLMQCISYTSGAFNIEFFYDPVSDGLKILEVNPRISQSHSELFKKVDGLSNEAIPVSLALGKKPDFPNGKGTSAIAGKFYLRTHTDAYVREAPNEAQLTQFHNKYPNVEVKIQAKQGKYLSDDTLQDSYSFELAQLFIGAGNEAELLQQYHECVNLLNFRLEETEEDFATLTSKNYQPSVERQSA